MCSYNYDISAIIDVFLLLLFIGGRQISDAWTTTENGRREGGIGEGETGTTEGAAADDFEQNWQG